MRIVFLARCRWKKVWCWALGCRYICIISPPHLQSWHCLLPLGSRACWMSFFGRTLLPGRWNFPYIPVFDGLILLLVKHMNFVLVQCGFPEELRILGIFFHLLSGRILFQLRDACMLGWISTVLHARITFWNWSMIAWTRHQQEWNGLVTNSCMWSLFIWLGLGSLLVFFFQIFAQNYCFSSCGINKIHFEVRFVASISHSKLPGSEPQLHSYHHLSSRQFLLFSINLLQGNIKKKLWFSETLKNKIIQILFYSVRKLCLLW